jgi:hypothetical protein
MDFVSLQDICKNFPDWRPNREILTEIGFRDLAPWGTSQGKVGLKELTAALSNADRDIRMTVVRGLVTVCRAPCPGIEDAIRGLALAARDNDREVRVIALKQLRSFSRAEWFYPLCRGKEYRAVLISLSEHNRLIRFALSSRPDVLENLWKRLTKVEVAAE